MGGWRRMSLDDTFQIRQAILVGLGSVFLLVLLEVVFHCKKVVL